MLAKCRIKIILDEWSGKEEKGCSLPPVALLDEFIILLLIETENFSLKENIKKM